MHGSRWPAQEGPAGNTVTVRSTPCTTPASRHRQVPGVRCASIFPNSIRQNGRFRVPKLCLGTPIPEALLRQAASTKKSGGMLQANPSDCVWADWAAAGRRLDRSRRMFSAWHHRTEMTDAGSRRCFYAEGVGQQSPGSRSAPWVAMSQHSHKPRRGFTSRMNHVAIVRGSDSRPETRFFEMGQSRPAATCRFPLATGLRGVLDQSVSRGWFEAFHCQSRTASPTRIVSGRVSALDEHAKFYEP